MRKNWGVFLSFFVLGFFLIAEAQINSPEKIEDFSVEIWIEKDSSFLVKESITYNFGKNLRHGIYRKIPLKDLKIKVEKVTDEFGQNYHLKITKERGYLKIRIGDPQKLVSGRKIYNIFYKVQNGISFFKDYDELYWNVTGNEWGVSIKSSKAILHLPEKVPQENLKLDCFTGHFGSKAKDCVFEIKENGDILFESKRSFYPREGLTIVLGFPKRIVREPNIFLRIFWKVEKYWIFLIPILTFIYLFLEWKRKGKDPRIKKAIVPQYEPPDNLRPAEVSLILKQIVESRDISATLIDLAVRGFVKIREIKKEGIFGEIFKAKDYEIEKLKDSEDLLEYERLLLWKIFKEGNKIKISSLKNKFYKDFQTITKKICQDVTKKKYFVRNPQKIRNKWMNIGISLIILGSILGPFFKSLSLLFSILISGILFLIFSPFMPKRSKKGTEALWYILGFRDYIETAEKYRAQFYEKENIFEKYLPYAICFDLVDKWAKAFEGIYKNPPEWYEGYYVGTFNTRSFSNSLNSAISSFGGILTAGAGKASGFGGGFAGGGGGGGGGGSW